MTNLIETETVSIHFDIDYNFAPTLREIAQKHNIIHLTIVDDYMVKIDFITLPQFTAFWTEILQH